MGSCYGNANLCSSKYRLVGIYYIYTLMQYDVIIPLAKRSFRGVYCFQPVRHSVILSFRYHFLMFCSVTLVALGRFCSNFFHTLTIRHCMFCRKKGVEGSVLQELCHFVILTARDHFFKVLRCNFSSPCLILFKSSPHLNHQTLHVL